MKCNLAFNCTPQWCINVKQNYIIFLQTNIQILNWVLNIQAQPYCLVSFLFSATFGVGTGLETLVPAITTAWKACIGNETADLFQIFIRYLKNCVDWVASFCCPTARLFIMCRFICFPAHVQWGNGSFFSTFFMVLPNNSTDNTWLWIS